MMIDMFTNPRAIGAALLVSAGLIGPHAMAADLIMVEEEGCYWCDAWDEDISHIYPKTLEGKEAPLKRVDIDSDLDDEIVLKRAVHFTPTFLLVEDGREVSRIEGYPGEDFFWGLLAQMLEELLSDHETVTTVSSN